MNSTPNRNEDQSSSGQSDKLESSLKPWSAFDFTSYRVLWLSGLSSTITMQIRLIGFGVWLYTETGSGIQLGILGLIQLAVQMPATLFGGAFADQMDRRKLISITQSFSFFFIGIAALLLLTDSLRPWHIYLIVGILGLTSTLGGPARSAITANVVPSSHLMHAVTTNTATFQISAIISPLLFSIAYEFVGLGGVFVLAIAASVPAAILPIFIRPRYGLDSADQAVKSSVIYRLWEGFRFVRQHPILPYLYLMDIGVTVVSFYRQIMPLVVDKIFKQGPSAIGLLTAANSVGGVIGSFLVLFLAKYRPKGMLVLYATGVYAILLFGFGSLQFLSVEPIVLMVIGGIIITALGATDAIGMTTRQTTVQLTTPDNMRGRAVSFHSFSAMAANNIGTFEVGFMSAQIGAGNTMLLGGVVSVIVVITVWRVASSLRDYRYP